MYKEVIFVFWSCVTGFVEHSCKQGDLLGFASVQRSRHPAHGTHDTHVLGCLSASEKTYIVSGGRWGVKLYTH